ncbi:MAG: GNAT family N-acetyltransferase [Saprospiraceae bacterium]|nr:GNAT family N-acetyltransferase [Saprospiraceae bacterium]
MTERKSERLLYRRLDASLYDDYHAFYSNAAATKYITGDVLSEDAIRDRFRTSLETNKDPEGGWYLVYIAASQQFIGVAKVTRSSQNSMEAEVGYGSLPAYWNQGYGAEMMEEMIALAKSIPEVSRLAGVIDLENVYSEHMLTKRGFVPGIPKEGIVTLYLDLA